MARVELEALLNELRRAVGLDGRDRPSGSGAERARVNVTRNIVVPSPPSAGWPRRWAPT